MDNKLFAEPFWLWLCLLVLPLLALRIWSSGKKQEQLRLWLAERFHLLRGKNNQNLTGWLSFILALLGFVFLCIAMARPQYGEQKVQIESDGRNLLMVFDVSKSMLAEDISPNRLSRAKLAALDLVNGLPGEQIGLIAFAGMPFLQAPMTTDHNAVIESIEQLDTSTIPRGGSNLDKALALAEKTLEETGSDAQSNAILLISDGDELEGSVLDRATKLGEKGVVIITIGVGTLEGGFMPMPNQRVSFGRGNQGRSKSGYIEDSSGKIVTSQLQEEVLQKIAQQANGDYLRLSSGNIQIKLVQNVLSKLETQRLNSSIKKIPTERYQYPLVLALCFLGLAHLLPKLLPLLLSRKVGKSSLGNFRDFGQSLQQKARPLFSKFSKKASLLLVASAFISDLPRLTAQQQTMPPEKAANTESAVTPETEESKLSYQSKITRPWNQFQRGSLEIAQGSEHYEHGNYEGAAQSFGNALAHGKEKDLARTHYNLGNTLYRQGEALLKETSKSQGKQNQQKTAKKEKKSETQEKVKAQWEQAIEQYEQSLQLRPEDEDTTFNLEFVKKKLEELKKQQEQQKQKEEEQEQQQDQEQKDEEQQKDQNEEGDGEEKDQQGKGGDPDKVDENTGFNKSQARAALDNFADEDKKVRLTPAMPRGGKNFKDW